MRAEVSILNGVLLLKGLAPTPAARHRLVTLLRCPHTYLGRNRSGIHRPLCPRFCSTSRRSEPGCRSKTISSNALLPPEYGCVHMRVRACVPIHVRMPFCARETESSRFPVATLPIRHLGLAPRNVNARRHTHTRTQILPHLQTRNSHVPFSTPSRSQAGASWSGRWRRN